MGNANSQIVKTSDQQLNDVVIAVSCMAGVIVFAMAALALYINIVNRRYEARATLRDQELRIARMNILQQQQQPAAPGEFVTIKPVT